MVIHLDSKVGHNVGKSSSKVHSIPFKIHADCDAKVSQYFDNQIRVEDDKTLKASFRGYPLRGQTIDLPKEYVGYVFHESIAPINENQERNFHIIHKFNSLTYWNWDKPTSKNDKIVQALEWIDIAEALHSPILE